MPKTTSKPGKASQHRDTARSQLTSGQRASNAGTKQWLRPQPELVLVDLIV